MSGNKNNISFQKRFNNQEKLLKNISKKICHILSDDLTSVELDIAMELEKEGFVKKRLVKDDDVGQEENVFSFYETFS